MDPEERGGGGGGGEAATGAGGVPLHGRSFKLRFAAQREPGRSNVSPVKPLGLPATVTGKFYVRARASEFEAAAERRALRRVRDMFRRGPRDKFPAPLTAAHEYGWWIGRAHEAGEGGDGGEGGDRRLQHHVRDSAWLKARLRVLAADAPLKQR